MKKKEMPTAKRMKGDMAHAVWLPSYAWPKALGPRRPSLSSVSWLKQAWLAPRVHTKHWRSSLEALCLLLYVQLGATAIRVHVVPADRKTVGGFGCHMVALKLVRATEKERKVPKPTRSRKYGL